MNRTTKLQIKYTLIGLLVVPVFGRLALAGTGHAGDLYRYLIPALVGCVAGFLIGRERGHYLDKQEELSESRSFLQSIIDNIPAPVYLKDFDGNYLFVNKQYELLTGVPREEIPGRSDFDIFSGQIAELFRSQDDQIRNGQVPLEFEESIPLKDGVHTFITHKFSLVDGSGAVYAVGGFCTDITRRRQTEKELAAERDFSAAIQSSLPGIFYVYDEDRRLIRWNRNQELLTGYTVDELANMRVEDWFDEGDREILLKNFNQMLEQGGKRHGCLPLTFKDGRKIPYNLSACRLQVDGKSFVVGVGFDISEMIRFQEALKQSRDFLQTVIDANPDPMMIITPEHQVVLANRSFSRISWYHDSDPVADSQKCHKYLYNLDYPCSADGFSCSLLKVVESKKVITENRRITTPDGAECTFEIMMAPIFNEAGEVVQVVKSFRNITERIQAELQLKERETKLKTILQTAPTGIGVVVDRVFQEVNQRFCDMVGYAEDELLGKNSRMVYPSDEEHERVGREEMELIRKHGLGNIESCLRHKSGRTINILVSWSPLNERDLSAGIVFNALDITETKKLEDQLFQSQKMESIGKLAGGVAHDFNNILTVINGYAQIIQMSLKGDSKLKHNVEQIQKAGNRAANLTRQLLGFSRKQMIIPVAVDINKLISEMGKMLGRIIGEDIQLTISLDEPVEAIYADPGQLEQILMNLVVNARDAINEQPEKAEKIIRISTSQVFLDAGNAGIHRDAVPGRYMLLQVEDNGCGMTEEVMKHIFEPFYTTKGIGKGTGMGLATVYGIVKQNNGVISCGSEPGQGAVFKIYWPTMAAEDQNAADEDSEPLAGGSETILLVEDDAQIREITGSQLREAGYTVIEAENGRDALERAGSHQGSIDLLFTDVIMPTMGGRELYEKIKAIYPDIPVLFGSGYTDDNLPDDIFNFTRRHFINKPYNLKEVLGRIHQLLNGR